MCMHMEYGSKLMWGQDQSTYSYPSVNTDSIRITEIKCYRSRVSYFGKSTFFKKVLKLPRLLKSCLLGDYNSRTDHPRRKVMFAQAYKNYSDLVAIYTCVQLSYLEFFSYSLYSSRHINIQNPFNHNLHEFRCYMSNDHIAYQDVFFPKLLVMYHCTMIYSLLYMIETTQRCNVAYCAQRRSQINYTARTAKHMESFCFLILRDFWCL